ncbi:prolipoprotein diacylglyceryl transferase [Paenibacillus tarimensis]
MYMFRIDPVAISLGPISIHWYGIILGSAALVGLLLAIREGKRFGITPDFFMDLLLLGVPSAIIGARLYYVAFKWDEYKDNLIGIIQIWNGGIAIYGALIGGIICGIFYFRYKGYNFWRIADICAPSLIAGQMIGRWGNYVNQEAYGGPTTEGFLRGTLNLPSWIVDQMWVVNPLTGEGSFHHPTFLYESMWSLIGLVLLFVIRRQSFLRAGELFAIYFIWYSIGRFYIEGLRTDSLAFQGPSWLESIVAGLWSPMTGVFEAGYLDPGYGNVRISQVVAILLILAGIAFIIIRRITGPELAKYADPIVSSKHTAALQASEAGTEPADPETIAELDKKDASAEATEEPSGKEKADDEKN